MGSRKAEHHAVDADERKGASVWEEEERRREGGDEKSRDTPAQCGRFSAAAAARCRRVCARQSAWGVFSLDLRRAKK
jgi:hypothetical protein